MTDQSNASLILGWRIDKEDKPLNGLWEQVTGDWKLQGNKYVEYTRTSDDIDNNVTYDGQVCVEEFVSGIHWRGRVGDSIFGVVLNEVTESVELVTKLVGLTVFTARTAELSKKLIKLANQVLGEDYDVLFLQMGLFIGAKYS